MAAVIVVPDTVRQRFLNKLDTCAGYRWSDTKLISLIAIPQNLNSHKATELIEATINQLLDRHEPYKIWLPSELDHLHGKLQKKDLPVLRLEKGVSKLLDNTDTALFNELSYAGLDWFSRVHSVLQRYLHKKIEKQDIKNWLDQFQQLGYKYVGEHLLQLLEIPITSDISTFFGNTLSSTNYLLAYHEDKELGKSGQQISNILKNQFKSRSIYKSDEVFAVSKENEVICFVEDGLFSGTETCSILGSLAGKPNKNKVRPIKLNCLYDNDILLQYAVTCDYGIDKLNKYLAQNKFNKVKIGQEYIKFTTLDTSGFVSPYIFQNDKGWTEQQNKTAKIFCEKVGRQLWSAYLKKRKQLDQHFDMDRWDDDRITRCAFGMESLGLAFAFAHSVPKATLPLFWANGSINLEVDKKNKSIDWKSLF